MIFGGRAVRGCESWDITATENRNVSVMCEVEMVLVILQHLLF